MSLFTRIQCDDCGHVAKDGMFSPTMVPETARAWRDVLKHYGWRVRLPGGKDICPECHGDRLEKADRERIERRDD